MQKDQDQNGPQQGSQAQHAENHMATNPNPRANENIKNTSFDKNTTEDDMPDVGSEITDGEAS